ncbi:hypothetical protein [Sphingomonas sp. Mn802worker]|uniref:hypothetical protein n=1 Tax=Sphingomonas sp. Mn802worker TaxID=629773 RepID=UPI000379B63D|nr:hypothetical protein [Sphingomonas sp. Mn802worker]
MTTIGAALLGACSPSSDADYNTVHVDPAQARAQAQIDRAAAAQGARTAARSGLPVATTTPTSAGARKLPVAFQGYWGRTPGDCALANVDAQGRLAIEADQLRFFRQRARVDALGELSANEVDATLSFKHDDTRWTHPTRLTLEQGGTRLLMVEQGDAGRPGQTARYQRC